jgi:hypothetical protein
MTRKGDTIPNQAAVEAVVDARLGGSTGAGLGAKVDVALVAGTKAVADANVTANTKISIAGVKTVGGTPGAKYVASKTPGTGYTISSTSATDTSTVQVRVDYDG